MKTTFVSDLRGTGLILVFLAGLLGGQAQAQTPPQFTRVQPLNNREILLHLSAPANQHVRIDVSGDLSQWHGLITFLSTGFKLHNDTAAPYLNARFYRAAILTNGNTLTGDHVPTSAGDAVIHPVNHASFVIQWNGMMIYNDPVGGATPYTSLPRANLILVSHRHGDHFNASTLDAVRTTGTVIVAPPDVYARMSAALQGITLSLPNGATTNVLGMAIEAIPAYNGFHPSGTGNGYVLTLGGTRLYMAGDTADVAEMRALTNIDVAFLPMNLPFTMDVPTAADATRAFRPGIVYPYHYRNQDGTFADRDDFKQRVGSDLGIEVRNRDWY